MAGNLTPFGKELRKLRIDRDETLKGMAEKLKFTPSYLSAIECGKREPTMGVVLGLTKAYRLTEEEYHRLIEARVLTVKEVCVNLEGATNDQRVIAFLFARYLKTLSDKELDEIWAILHERESEE